MKKRIGLAAFVAAALLGGLAYAGSFISSFPTTSLPLTGNETVMADTQLGQGLLQTEQISMAQIKGYVLGNSATASGTATATAGAATLNAGSGVITSESLTTAAGAVYTLTLTNSAVSATSKVFVSIGNGTNSAGSPALTTVVPGSGSVVIKVQNIHSANAFNGTITAAFFIIN